MGHQPRPSARLSRALVLAAALLGAQSISGGVALAASHHQPRSRAADCHHVRGNRRCARAGAHAKRPPSVTRALASRPLAPAAVGPCVNAELVPTASNASQISAAALCLVNQQRALHGEGALRENAELDSAAMHHSRDMVASNYADHISPSGETPLQRVAASGYLPGGYAYELGENLAVGTLQLATPAATVTGWMNSPPHRANILDGDYVDSGIGVVAQAPAQFAGGEAGATYTQEFGVLQAP
jgi:uncharacterized protein YkwD